MIVDTVAIKLNSPDAYFINKKYSSGIVPQEKPIYVYAYPSSGFPVVIFPQKLFDESGNSISDGYYSVILSEDKKFLLLVQSSVLKAKVPVAKFVEVKLTPEEAAEESEIKDRIEVATFKKKWKKLKQAEKDLKDFNTRQQAKMSAELLDSGQGYYVLKYLKQNQKAWGIISK